MKLHFTILVLFICTVAAGQSPGYFRYQGIARDTTGNPVSNDTISLRISIHAGSAGGTVVYQETHHPITNEFGLFSINIGGGTLVAGNFSGIGWERNNYFQQTEMDITGGNSYSNMGTSQYLSVPYAFGADTALVANSSIFAVLADSAIRAKHSVLADTSVFARHSSRADSAITGIAPFEVKNTANGNTIASVAIIATGNSDFVPAMFVRNQANGDVFNAAASNGKYFLVSNAGIETNGTSLLGDAVSVGNQLTVNGSTQLNGPATIQGNLNVSGTLSQLTGQFNIGGPVNITNNLSVGGLLTGGINVSGALNVTGNQVINGDLTVNGNLAKASGSFKIDHPLDPLNKILYHSFVESPDMKNIYDGNVITDADGNAVVELPGYFEALNRDFRYQLTTIGQFSQAIISKEIENNIFHIKTDKPGVKVCWQVTGIRKDDYAEKHRIVPEVEKSKEEKGKLLYPENN